MGTKEKILMTSLNLFSKKGFEGVSVREIAGEVGVRESALYKHFRNKQEILDSIIQEISERIEKAYIENGVPEAVTSDISKGYESLSSEQLCDIAWNLFEMYVKDPMISNYRKLLVREQFNHSEAAAQYNNRFVVGVIKKQSMVFEQLVNSGFFRKEDTEVIALHFYGPIFLLFQQYDCNPEQENEIKERLFKHVTAFGNLYRRG